MADGPQQGSVFNSYEFGVNATLAFRGFAPKFVKRSNRDIKLDHTLNLGASILNRPHFSSLLNSTPASHMSGGREAFSEFVHTIQTYL